MNKIKENYERILGSLFITDQPIRDLIDKRFRVKNEDDMYKLYEKIQYSKEMIMKFRFDHDFETLYNLKQWMNMFNDSQLFDIFQVITYKVLIDIRDKIKRNELLYGVPNARIQIKFYKKYTPLENGVYFNQYYIKSDIDGFSIDIPCNFNKTDNKSIRDNILIFPEIKYNDKPVPMHTDLNDIVSKIKINIDDSLSKLGTTSRKCVKFNDDSISTMNILLSLYRNDIIDGNNTSILDAFINIIYSKGLLDITDNTRGTKLSLTTNNNNDIFVWRTVILSGVYNTYSSKSNTNLLTVSAEDILNEYNKMIK